MSAPNDKDHRCDAQLISAATCRLVQRQYPRAYASCGTGPNAGSGMVRLMQPGLLITWWPASGPAEFMVKVSEGSLIGRLMRVKIARLAPTVMRLVKQAMDARARELEGLALEIATCSAG